MSSSEASPIEPGVAREVVAARLAPIALTGAFAGLVEGAVRFLGIDPGLFLLQVEHFGLGDALIL
ncbi:MAG: hypothetical protein AAGA20_20855, partial [Planctomycetota bacterium]